MGRLIGIELENFKSYRGKTLIGFGTSCFTSIIGPNGSGKSNMMDAISFVLGVKSSQLRSQNLRDLVYRGRRIDQDDSGDASLDTVDVDPTRAYVMAKYEKENGEIIQLKRTITVNGNTDYKINDKIVTALQYSTVLKNENILLKARNFLVFQGDVELIASQSPQDLTKLIETISGSNEFSKDYDYLKEEMEKAHEFSNSVFSRKRNLNSESKQYRDQLVEQETFEKKLTDKSNLTKLIHLYKLYHNEKQHHELMDILSSKNKELKFLNQRMASEEANYKNLMSQYSKDSLSNKKFVNRITDMKQQIESKKREIIPIDANKKSLINKINTSKNKIKDITYDIENQQSQVNSTKKKLKEAKKLFGQFEDKVNASISSSLSKEAHEEYEELRSKFLSNGGSQLEEQLSLLSSERDSLLTILDNNNTQLSVFNSKIKELELRKNGELQTNLEAITSEINDILAMKSEKIFVRDSMIKEKEGYNYKELQLNSQLRDVLVKIDELLSQQRESTKQKKARDNVSMLKKLLPPGSIKGLVYDLVRPTQKKYENSLLTLLGRHFDSIVVETTSTAYKCIEILKERRVGIATFIPLDTVFNENINLNYLRSIHKQAQPGVDIVEYDDTSLEQAIHYIIGGSLVVDNLSIARQLKWESNHKLDCKMVTLEGSVINRSGLMTGGQQVNRLGASLSWDKKELNTLTELKDDLTQKLDSIAEKRPKEMEINLFNESINELDDKLPLLRNQKESAERIIQDAEREIEFQKESIKQLEAAVDNKRSYLTEIEMNMRTVDIDIEAIQKEIYSDFCSQYGFKDGIKSYEGLHGSALRHRAKERAQYVKTIATLNSKLEFETESLESTKPRKENIEKQLGKYETELHELLEFKESIESQTDKLEAELEISEEDKAKFETKLQEQLKYAGHVEGDINDMKQEISKVSKAITNSEENILKVDIERVNELKNCKIDNINIPLKDGLLESISLNESVDQLAKDTYKIDIDYELLNDRLRETYSTKIEAELHARLQTVLEEIEQLTPNAKAAARLKEAEKRLKVFDKDFTKARQQENKVVTRFEQIKESRQQAFMEAFEHVSSKIDSIYKDLTKTQASPLGGSAYLTLEDEDEPYTAGIKYHAMPPMKRFRDMDLLSGGEKTIAALALLFAVHSYQPSPFFVLDEVDAALDSSNVNKIANYIKKNSSSSFQFIVISLKNTLFEKSDALVGIYREKRENTSKTVTLDLRDYPEEETPIIGATA